MVVEQTLINKHSVCEFISGLLLLSFMIFSNNPLIMFYLRVKQSKHISLWYMRGPLVESEYQTFFESLILAQDERWRCALSMQVERDQQWSSGRRVSNA